MKPIRPSGNRAFLLALLVIMTVYLPTLNFGFLNFDDVDILNSIHDQFDSFQLEKLFLFSHTKQYYRPLLELICYMDYALWGQSISAWHITNYTLHLANATLVYLISKQWLLSDKNKTNFAAVSMLFFALNPMTCESVVWISGRSDLAGTFFALVAVSAYYLNSRVRYFLVPLSILAGMFCKENALAVIPIIILIDTVRQVKRRENLITILKNMLKWAILTTIPFLIYFFFRTNGFEHYFYESEQAKAVAMHPMPSKGPDSDLSSTKIFGVYSINDILFLFPVIAFYIKKLIIPFPLNFAIASINKTVYSVFFLFLCLINFISILYRKWTLPVFFLILILSFSPSLIVALDKVAWVPMAERYLYLSLAVMSIGTIAFIQWFSLVKKIPSPIIVTAVIILLSINTICTFHRQFDFNDDKSIWRATLKTNPENSMVLCLYGQYSAGKEKRRAFEKAVANPEPFKWRDKATLTLAEFKMAEGKYQEAIQLINKALKIKKNYDNYYRAATIIYLADIKDDSFESKRFDLALEYFQEAYKKRKTADAIYKIASSLKQLGKKAEARIKFNELIKRYPKSEYAKYAEKHLRFL
nr:tetratricopeptide repeat protein [uncultured Desulfobacter sp.]